MTKAARILELYALGKTPREIADEVGCRSEYVRVVARQRKGGGQSECDRRYRASPSGKATSARASAKYRSRLMATGDVDMARAKARKAYAAALANGKSISEAQSAYGKTHSRVLRDTAAEAPC